MIYRLIVYAAISAGCYFSAIRWLGGFAYEDFKDYVTLLSAVSGMVFTIMGIWIAFLYPNAMSRILDPKKLVSKDFSESRLDAKRLEGIVGAVLTSAIVMLLAMLLALAKLILSSTPLYADFRVQFKATALAILVLMTLIQLEAVFNVVISNVLFINDLHFRRQARQADADL